MWKVSCIKCCWVGVFVQVTHRWDPCRRLGLLVTHCEEGWMSWTRRSPPAEQPWGTRHPILHYGEVPCEPLVLRINPNLAGLSHVSGRANTGNDLLLFSLTMAEGQQSGLMRASTGTYYQLELFGGDYVSWVLFMLFNCFYKNLRISPFKQGLVWEVKLSRIQIVDRSHLRPVKGQRSRLSGWECILRLVGFVKIYKSNTILGYLSVFPCPFSADNCLNVNGKGTGWRELHFGSCMQAVSERGDS